MLCNAIRNQHTCRWLIGLLEKSIPFVSQWDLVRLGNLCWFELWNKLLVAFLLHLFVILRQWKVTIWMIFNSSLIIISIRKNLYEIPWLMVCSSNSKPIFSSIKSSTINQQVKIHTFAFVSLNHRTKAYAYNKLHTHIHTAPSDNYTPRGPAMRCDWPGCSTDYA